MNKGTLPKGMSPWQPGQSGNPAGRPRKLLHRVDEILSKAGLHPVTELLKLLDELKPRDKAEIWLQLLSYVQAKPKELVLSDEETARMALENLSDDELVKMAEKFLPALRKRAG